jgi:hypothetical protein
MSNQPPVPDAMEDFLHLVLATPQLTLGDLTFEEKFDFGPRTEEEVQPVEFEVSRRPMALPIGILPGNNIPNDEAWFQLSLLVGSKKRRRAK